MGISMEKISFRQYKRIPGGKVRTQEFINESRLPMFNEALAYADKIGSGRIEILKLMYKEYYRP